MLLGFCYEICGQTAAQSSPATRQKDTGSKKSPWHCLSHSRTGRVQLWTKVFFFIYGEMRAAIPMLSP